MPFQWNDIVKDCVTPDGVARLTCIPALFQNVIGGTLLFAGIVALGFFIYAGVKFINSGGDPKQVEAAKNVVTYTVAGLLIILFSFLIVNLIADFTGTKCIKQFGFNNC